MLISKPGIMQGRLLPKYQGRYQAHPVGYWQQEFAIAKELGLDSIEFILDYNDAAINPLMSKEGLTEINNLISTTGINVYSVCADYFMEAPLHSEDEKIASQSRKILEQLIINASEIGISDIVIPCVDQSSLKGETAASRLIQCLNSMRDVYEKHNVNMALETDLNPVEFAKLLEQLPSKNVTVNYDTGNSASLGYNITEEFEAYGNRISDIHIKDRELNGGSVVLGTGNTNFSLFFDELKKLNYKGIFIMQVYRDDEGVEIFKKQLKWFKQLTEQQTA